MEIVRDPGVISGFRFEHPLADLPAREGEVSWTPPDLEHESAATSVSEHHFLWIGVMLEQMGLRGAELARGLRGLAGQHAYVWSTPAQLDAEWSADSFVALLSCVTGRVVAPFACESS